MVGRKEAVVTTLSWLVLAAYSISFFVLMGRVRMGADDFFYACFWDQGFMGFVSATITHFYESSGRVFVHLFCSTALWLGMSAYQLTGTFLLVLLAISGALVATTGSFESSYAFFPGMRGNKHIPVPDNERGRLQEKHRFEGALVLFCVGLAGFSLLILREAVLWNAGVFNYLFPVCLQVLFFHALRKDLQRRNPSKTLWVLAFFCGATVEQTGILVVFSSLVLLVTHAMRHRVRPNGWQLLSLFSGALGYLTLFLSPGVAERLDKHPGATSLSVVEKIEQNLPIVARMVAGENGMSPLLILVTLLGFAYIIRRTKSMLERIVAAVSGLGTAGLLFLTARLLLISDRVVVLACIMAFVSLLYLCVRLWTFKEETAAFFLMLGLLSASVLLVSPVQGMRMLFPASVFFLVALCRVTTSGIQAAALAKGAMRLMRPVLWAGVLLLCIMAVFRQADVHAGYARNEPVLQANLEKTALAAKTGAKTLVLAPLPDERYGYENLPVNWNFTEWYIRFYHLPKDIVISVADPTGTPLRVQGMLLSDGIIVREQVQYVPVRAAFEALGYKVYWEKNSAVAESGETKFLFKSASSIVRIQQPGGSQTLRLKAPVRSIHAQVHIPVDFLVHTLGGALEQTTEGYQLTY